jgi:hypothetical protein
LQPELFRRRFEFVQKIHRTTCETIFWIVTLFPKSEMKSSRENVKSLWRTLILP